MKLTDIKNSLNEISAIGGLKQVVKGNTKEVEGIKLSKEMAQAMIDWFNSSPYGRKYPNAKKGRLHLSLGIMGHFGLDRYAKHKGAKEELKYIKDLSKAMRDNVNEESLNEGKHDAILDKLADIVGNAKSFMDIGKELKSNGIKYSFGTNMIPMYIIDKPVKIAILNKKYADGAEREVGSTAIGLMESIKESKSMKLTSMLNENKYSIIDPRGNAAGTGTKDQANRRAKQLGGNKKGYFVVPAHRAKEARRAMERFKFNFKNAKLQDKMSGLYFDDEMFGESVVNEGKFKVDDLVYNKRTKTVGIVRMGDDKYGEVKTDADGNVDVDDLEKYNPIKFKHQSKAKAAPSTQKEVSKRGLFNPFKSESVNEAKFKVLASFGGYDLIEAPTEKDMIISKNGKKVGKLTKISKYLKDDIKSFIKMVKSGKIGESVNEGKDVGHYERVGNQTIVDSNFVNYSKGVLPNSELVHLGMGDFAIKSPKGMIKFQRSGKLDGIGQDFVGRPHRMTDDKNGKLVDMFLKLMLKKKKAILSMSESAVNEAKYDIGMARKGNGLTVYNKAEEENGDYKNVAHIDNKGKIKYLDKKVPSNIKKQIEAEAKKMMEITKEGTMKLKDILKESFKSGKVYSNPFHTPFVKENDVERREESSEMTNEQKKAFLEAVKAYKSFGETVYRNEGLAEVYESIKNVVESAGKNMVKETEGSFDGITVGRHVKRMNESFKIFEKTLREVGTLQQRLESTYDEIGEVLGKYYEINETEETDIEEGNEFGASRAKAIANGDSEFEVDGKKYPVKDVSKDDKENAKKFANESKGSTMKLKQLLNESFGYGELPSEKLMKMKVSAKDMLDSVKNKKTKAVVEGYSTEEKRIVLLAVRKLMKYKNIDINLAAQYVVGAAEELKYDIDKGKVKK